MFRAYARGHIIKKLNKYISHSLIGFSIIILPLLGGLTKSVIIQNDMLLYTTLSLLISLVLLVLIHFFWVTCYNSSFFTTSLSISKYDITIKQEIVFIKKVIKIDLEKKLNHAMLFYAEFLNYKQYYFVISYGKHNKFRGFHFFLNTNQHSELQSCLDFLQEKNIKIYQRVLDKASQNFISKTYLKEKDAHIVEKDYDSIFNNCPHWREGKTIEIDFLKLIWRLNVRNLV